MPNHCLIYALTVLAALVALAQCKDLVIGEREDGDSLVRSTHVREPVRVGRGRSYMLTVYVPKDEVTITAIELYDQNDDENGASAWLLQGGPGERFFTVGFSSHPGHAIEYDVKVYAK